jgi:hypothetical protein
MSRRFHRYGLLLLFLAMAFVIGCEKSSRSVNVAGPTTFSTVSAQSAFTAQPTTLLPEFLPGFTCAGSRAFGTRIIIVVNDSSNLFLSGLNFRFRDRMGITALPQVIPIPGSSPLTMPIVSIPTSSPIPPLGVAPLPTAAPIPFAGNGNPIPSQFPFLLTFGCGLFAQGTLFVSVDAGDRSGRIQRTEFTVQVGQ